MKDHREHAVSEMPPVIEERFGLCPKCFRQDGYYNLHRGHWFVCDQHRVRWCAGSNLFGSWRTESSEDWESNWERIGDYEVVVPATEVPSGGDWLPTEVLQDLHRVIEYLWADEARHYFEQSPTTKPGHIFESVFALRMWLRRDGNEEDGP